MDKYLVCLICCEEFEVGRDGEDLGSKEQNVESLKQFCEVILEVDKNGVGGNGDLLWCLHGNGKIGKKESYQSEFGGELEEVVSVGLNDKISKFLNNPDDNLSMCGNCLDLIKTVTEARLSAKCVEESVEKLQVLLLRELRRLQGRLELFWGEFRKVEETLAKGDLKLIGNNLDESYFKVNDGGKRKSRSKISQMQSERKTEIFGFREKISQVFRDLHQFKEKLNDKIACDPVRHLITSNTANSSKKIVHIQDRSPEKRRMSMPKPADKHPRKENDKGFIFQPNSEEIERAHDKDEDDNDGNINEEPMHHDNFDDDDDDFSEDNPVPTTSPADKRASLRRRNTRKKYEEEPSDSDEDHDDAGVDGGEDCKPEVSSNSKQVGTKQGDKRRRGRRKKQNSSNSGQDGEEQNSSDDDEYKPEEPDEKSIISAKIKQLFQEYESHLTQMPPFKCNVIRSVLKTQFLNENQQNKKGADKLNIFQRHMTYLSYNTETQLISLKDIPIKILCQADEEDVQNGLLCMKCSFTVAECPKMENLMWEHVLSKHLNAYQCPHCTDKEFKSYNQYHMHLYRCLRRKEKADQVECDICGRSICDPIALQRHKWSHMNEEERKEALEKGLVKKIPINSKKGLEKIFQCEQCGKSFSHKSYLEKHEVTHKDRDSREQFICPKCGKSFLETGYKYHLKYGGSCWEDDPNRKKETCGICGMILLNKVILKRHVKDMHTEADFRPFGCSFCGKSFKKKMTLKLHERMHTGEKPWNCGKCGKAFSRQNNMRKHEETCGK